MGRTGAGKSSLIAMLMILVGFKGKITIDDVNIQTIGLNDLRNVISIIPQVRMTRFVIHNSLKMATEYFTIIQNW